MKAVLKPAAVILILLNISACSWLFGDDGIFRDSGNDYRKARVEPPLKLPKNIDGDAIDDSYAIPPIDDRTSLSGDFVVPRPEPMQEVDQDNVRINTLGDSRWILANGSPGQVWPRLRGFLNLNHLRVERADASSGILETGWLQPKGEGLLQERYRLRIEQGIQRGTSEVYVLQADLRAGKDQWPKHSTNVEREKLMVQELAQYLADSAAAAAVSMLAQQAIDSSGRVSLREDDKQQPYLQLQLPFPRAWASIERALERAGFTVDDLNREQRTYYVSYKDKDDEEDEPGFFSSLFGGDKDDKGTPYLLYVKESDAETVHISIAPREKDQTLEKQEAKKLLQLIKIHLS